MERRLKALKKLERLVCKLDKKESRHTVFEICLIHQLCIKFTEFKLHKSSKQFLTQVSAQRQFLVTAEINSHSRCINTLKSEFLTLKQNLSQNIDRFSLVHVYINRFLEQQKKEYEIKCFKTRQKTTNIRFRYFRIKKILTLFAIYLHDSSQNLKKN